jgi:hypothetical protein
MNIAKRIKGLIIAPDAEWAIIEAEDKSVAELYRGYIVYLALIPPFASFLGGHFFGFGRGPGDVEHLSFAAGLTRAFVQYALSLPLLYLVAFVLSSLAPHFDGKADDRRALALAAYSYTLPIRRPGSRRLSASSPDCDGSIFWAFTGSTCFITACRAC